MTKRIERNTVATHVHRSEGRYRVAAKPDRTYGGTTFRSMAEAKYAARLDLLRRAESRDRVAAWAYEPRRFPLEAGGIVVAHYKPDFRVDYADGRTEWIEIKGVMTTDAALMIRFFRACYPDLCLRVLDSRTLDERLPRGQRGANLISGLGSMQVRRKPRPSRDRGTPSEL